jgi:hypothetical protein
VPVSTIISRDQPVKHEGGDSGAHWANHVHQTFWEGIGHLVNEMLQNQDLNKKL